MMESDDAQFVRIIDELVIASSGDPEFVEGLHWIDTQAHKEGVSFYDMAMIVLRRHIANKKAREWLRDRSA